MDGYLFPRRSSVDTYRSEGRLDGESDGINTAGFSLVRFYQQHSLDTISSLRTSEPPNPQVFKPLNLSVPVPLPLRSPTLEILHPRVHPKSYSHIPLEHYPKMQLKNIFFSLIAAATLISALPVPLAPVEARDGSSPNGSGVSTFVAAVGAAIDNALGTTSVVATNSQDHANGNIGAVDTTVTTVGNTVDSTIKAATGHK